MSEACGEQQQSPAAASVVTFSHLQSQIVSCSLQLEKMYVLC